MSTLVVLTKPEEALPLLRWAGRFAAGRSGALTVLCWLPGLRPRPAAAPIRGAGGREDPLVIAAREAVTEIGVTDAEFLEFRHGDPVRGILECLAARPADLLIQATDGRQPLDSYGARLDDRILRAAPCDVLLLDPSGNEEARCERIVVPMGLDLDSFALQEAGASAGNTVEVVPLAVVDHAGSQEHEAAEQEMEAAVRACSLDSRIKVTPHVVFADRAIKGVAEHAPTADLILIGTTIVNALYELRAMEARGDWHTAIGLIRPARLRGSGFGERLRKRLLGWLPRMEPFERVDLVDRLQGGTRWNADFVLMITLSAAIAALGLLQDSTAVVMGAMVVAPLMTPLIGSGLALVQGNFAFFRDAVRTMGYGILAAIVVAFLFGVLTPQSDVTLEMFRRGGPTILDLGVALLSSFAAAYALARPSLLGALAGVAMAAALVPPLATVGLALGDGAWGLAKGAGILFVTNLVAIILGSALVFAGLGIRSFRPGVGHPVWKRRVVVLLVLALVLLLGPLYDSLYKSVRVGQVRPLAFPVSTEVAETIYAHVEREPGMAVLLMGRAGIPGERRGDIGVYLVTDRPVRPGFEEELAVVVRRKLHADAVVVVRVLQQAAVEDGKERNR